MVMVTWDNQSTGATQVDDFINNPTQWRDSDGDGYGDNQASGATQIDAFVDNPTQWEDSDGDGYGDNQASGATQVDASLMIQMNGMIWMGMDGETTKMIVILSLVRHLLMSAVVWIPMAMGTQTTVMHSL